MKKLMIIQAAALGYEFFKNQKNLPERLQKLDWQKLETVTPAVTCTAQSTFRTALPASGHGMVGNGFFFDDLNKPLFWEQSGTLVQGKRIWEDFRAKGKTVASLFWQQSLGNDVDILLSPAPIHKHHGGMIQDCYCQPTGLYPKLKKKIGGFNLMNYWGPLASHKSTNWIVNATIEVMKDYQPDLLLTYLPHLDYELQKTGPNSPKAIKAFGQFAEQLDKLLAQAEAQDYEFVIWGDYAIMDVKTPLYPNKVLREKGYLNFRHINAMLYPDYFTSKAMAIVDHQVAHIKVWDKSLITELKKVFEGTKGIAEVIVGEATGEHGAGHPRAGELILVSDPDCWFSYQWFNNKKEAPDYATHVDIHNKPGYDPCELFFGFPPPFNVSLDSNKIKGSHGLAGTKFPTAWASTTSLNGDITTLLDLAKAVEDKLNKSE